MNKLRHLALASLNLIFLSSVVLAQTRPPDPGAPECAGCGVCGGSLLVMILIPVVIIALNIALLVWVARDAKARSMDNAVMWMILVMFTSVLGLLIYVFSRPQGNLVKCQSCGNNRLQASAKCPHCGNP
jgi:FtsH-binding integral membrane protein